MNMSDVDPKFLEFLSKESAESIGLILAGVAAAVVSITYSLRHLKTSNCCGFSCSQVPSDLPQQVVVCSSGEKPARITTEV